MKAASAAAAAAAAIAMESFYGSPTSSGDDMGFTLHVLSNETAQKYGGFCLDGTPPGYYLRPGSDANKWIYHQRGGGWCISIDDCTSRAKSDLGSSKYFLPNISRTPNVYTGIMTNDALSPYADWNVVFVEYCDGSSWTSDNDLPVPGSENNTLWFRGMRAQQAVFAHLEATHGLLSNATDFVFTGTSAGGLAVYLTAERVQGYFDTPARAEREAAAAAAAGVKGKAVSGGAPSNTLNFVALPDSAWFMDSLDVGGNPTFRNWFLDMTGPTAWNNSRGTNQRCIADTDPTDAWKCSFAPHVYPRYTAPSGIPFFISQSMADAWQTRNVLGLPCDPSSCSAAFQNDFLAFQATLQTNVTAAHAAAPASDGLYLTGCYQHGQTCSDGDFFNQTENGQSQSATFAAWLNGAGGKASETGLPWPAAQNCFDGAHGWC